MVEDMKIKLRLTSFVSMGRGATDEKNQTKVIFSACINYFIVKTFYAPRIIASAAPTLFAVWARYQPLLNVFNLCLSKIPWQSLVCVVQVVGGTDEGECNSL